jgi:diguanylate cyclase (GGDEF)-like protein
MVVPDYADVRHAWHTAAAAPNLTPTFAAEALAAMEFHRVRFLDEQLPAAERIRDVAAAAGWEHLSLRAELVLANIIVRRGDLLAGSLAIAPILARGEVIEDAFLIARSHYLLAWVSYFLGDSAAAQIHATLGVDMLDDGAPPAVALDHLMILAITCYGTAEGTQYFAEAQQLAERAGDPERMITLYNNMAFSAAMRGEADLALENVDKMLAATQRLGTPLVAIHIETMARSYIAAGQHRRAIEVLQPVLLALDGTVEPGDVDFFADPHAQASSLITLSLAHRALGELDTAQHLLDRTRELAAARNLHMFEPQILQEQSQIWVARGDYRAAYDTFVHFHEATMAQQSSAQRAQAQLARASFNAERARREAEQYREMAMRDSLTGLHNRRYLDAALARAIDDAKNTGALLSAAIVDADLFKRVNDSLSHEVGDEVLRTLSAILSTVAPADADVCRLGGEEFVLLMPGLDALSAYDACESIRRSVESFDWELLTHSIPVTVSIGVTTADGGRTSAAALLADADRNLYAAKRSGRNRVMGDAR